ncbi:hypothetical protein CcI49_20255 [Frankia sp. CcI49]|uniref:Zn-ribbon domain-containing OB-fold protein n=1 Tax=unclassified Frankia TaxID=2632575 RepID=UPI0006CA5AE2|nr:MULTISPECIES: OB-fold domain-containing protein [unclassified Frankia]KPM54358.1 hypothetical protein ACG83_20700 [Frankia sp. R43]ONH58759.1 hypothetical protein CcI49_20255 [Frankia sp. CcI49]
MSPPAAEPVHPPWIAPFWAGADRGALLVQHCDDCGTPRFPPGPRCGVCTSDRCTWRPVSGHGRVLSWTRTHHPFGAGLRDRVPYTVVLVELVERPGLAMFGNLVPDGAITAGTPVRAVFVHTPAQTLVQWEPCVS